MQGRFDTNADDVFLAVMSDTFGPLRCTLCGNPVTPDSDQACRQVHWFEDPAGQAATDPMPTGSYAHLACVEAAEAALGSC